MVNIDQIHDIISKYLVDTATLVIFLSLLLMPSVCFSFVNVNFNYCSLSELISVYSVDVYKVILSKIYFKLTVNEVEKNLLMVGSVPYNPWLPLL